MTNRRTTNHDHIVHHMVEVVLNDILNSVIHEFETATGTRLGAVRIGRPDAITDRRTAEIDILKADSSALNGLMRYQKLLCEHEPLKNSDFCRSEGLEENN